MAASLSVDLREGVRQVHPQAEEGDRNQLVRTRVLSRGSRAERREALLAVVLAYRAGPKGLWGPVLLDLLAPAILERLQRLKASPPVLDDEDIRQEFVAEVLEVADTMPLPPTSFVRRQLMARANQAVRRRLARENQIQAGQCAFDQGRKAAR